MLNQLLNSKISFIFNYLKISVELRLEIILRFFLADIQVDFLDFLFD